MANKWLQHVKQVKAQNKDKSLKEVLKLAAQSYKKQKGGGSCADSAAPVGGEAMTLVGGNEHMPGKDKEQHDGEQQQGGKKRRSRKNRKQKQQQGGKKRSRKYKGKKSKRRAAGKKARRTRRRRRR